MQMKLHKVIIGKDAPSFDGERCPLGTSIPNTEGVSFPNSQLLLRSSFFTFQTLKALEMPKHDPKAMPKPGAWAGTVQNLVAQAPSLDTKLLTKPGTLGLFLPGPLPLSPK